MLHIMALADGNYVLYHQASGLSPVRNVRRTAHSKDIYNIGYDIPTL